MITPDVEKFFGGDSPMQNMRGEVFHYEPRPQQVEMALAVAQSQGQRILIPFNNCDNYIAGVQSGGIGMLIADAVRELTARVGSFFG